jgi:hypothetical protein
VKNHVVNYRITVQLVGDNLKQGSELVLNDSENIVGNGFFGGGEGGRQASGGSRMLHSTQYTHHNLKHMLPQHCKTFFTD